MSKADSTGKPPQPETLTVLMTRGRILAVKTHTVRRDGSIETEGYGRAKNFKHRVISIDSKGAWLEKLGPQKQSFVVMGAPVDWAEGEIKTRTTAGDLPTLIDVPRKWMPIDIDRIDFEPMFDDGEGIALEVMQHLSIKGSRCVWHLTASHGIDDRCRIRLWVRLKTPMTCAQMLRFAKARWDDESLPLKVDMSLYRPGQPIYTGDPIYVGGSGDPIAGSRVGFVTGRPLDAVAPEASLYEGDDPRPDDPNIKVLDKAGLYIGPIRDEPGRHEITCPWSEEHSEGKSTATYFEPHYHGHDIPGFNCFHDHCADRTWYDVEDELGIKSSKPKRTKDSFQRVKDTRDECELITIRASDVEPEPVEWLWPDRFALGKLSMIAGNPEGGKSTVAIDISARVTKGLPWPVGDEGRAPNGSVVMLSAEDSNSDTIVPRLMAAQADRRKVHIVQSVKAKSQNKGERGFDLTKDLARLDAKIEKISDVKLVIIDPITAYGSGSNMDWNSTGHVRSFLKPLAELADRHKLAVLIIAHLNKKQASGAAQMAVSGSVGQVAAARSVALVVNSKEDTSRKLFLSAKNNLAPPKQGLAYRIETIHVSDKKVRTSRVIWEKSYVDITADEAMKEDKDRRHTRNEAADWLRGFLAEEKKPAVEVKEAASKAGYSKSTLDRAKDEIGITPERHGFGDQGGWTWGLPKRKMVDEDVI